MVEASRVPSFFQLLAQGFLLQVQVGCSLRDLLCRQLGLSEDYVDQRIQTIFLDGKAVDDVDGAVVRQNSTLALSAAMPGLAGATLRRGGAYKTMRSQISHITTGQEALLQDGTLTLKLFNLVAGELGSGFLKQGVWIGGKALKTFFRKLPGDFFQSRGSAAQIDGEPVDVNGLDRFEGVREDTVYKLMVVPTD